MKTALCLITFFLLGNLSQAEGPIQITAEVLQEKANKLVQAQNSRSERTTKTLLPSSSRDPLRDSTILALNGNWTFVPKGSILTIPSRFKRIIANKPKGQLMPFPEFLRKNHAWLSTREVNADEIIGKLEEPEAFYESLKSSNTIVVATRGEFPVSTAVKKK